MTENSTYLTTEPNVAAASPIPVPPRLPPATDPIAMAPPLIHPPLVGGPPPGPGSAYQWPAPPPPPRKGWPAWAWVVTGAGALAVLTAIGLVINLVIGSALPHQLLDENFSAGSGVFEIGSSTDFDYQVIDGTYAITSRTESAGGATSFGELDRTAYVVDASVDVASVTADPSAVVVLAIGCSDATGNQRYQFLVERTGTKAVIDRIENGAARTDPLAATNSISVGPVHQLRLECATANPFGGTEVDLTAWVNGEQVLAAHDLQGYDAFQSMTIGLGTDQQGVQVRFDNARAVVPGE